MSDIQLVVSQSKSFEIGKNFYQLHFLEHCNNQGSDAGNRKKQKTKEELPGITHLLTDTLMEEILSVVSERTEFESGKKTVKLAFYENFCLP